MVDNANIDELLEVYEEEMVETHIMKQRQAIGTTWMEDPQVAKKNFPAAQQGKGYTNVRRFPDTLKRLWEVTPEEWRKDVIKRSKNALVGSVNHQVIKDKLPLGKCPMSWIPKLVPEVEDPELISNPEKIVKLFEIIVRGMENDEDFCPGKIVETAMNSRSGSHTQDAGPLNTLRGMPALLKRAQPFYALLRSRWVVEFTFTIMIHVMAYLSGRRICDKNKVKAAAATMPTEVVVPRPKPTKAADDAGTAAGMATINVKPSETSSSQRDVPGGGKTEERDEKEDDTPLPKEPDVPTSPSVFDGMDANALAALRTAPGPGDDDDGASSSEEEPEKGIGGYVQYKGSTVKVIGETKKRWKLESGQKTLKTGEGSEWTWALPGAT